MAQALFNRATTSVVVVEQVTIAVDLIKAAETAKRRRYSRPMPDGNQNAENPADFLSKASTTAATALQAYGVPLTL